MNYPVQPTKFQSNTFDWEWYERDFFHSPDGIKEFPNHHCKDTWVKSLPYIKSNRNAVDIGCRDGEYARYLHKHFNHVFCFDYRTRKLFDKNVDLSKITHFKCALGEATKVISVSGAGSIDTAKVPKEKWYYEQLYTLDQFNLQDVDYIKIDVDGYEKKVVQGAIKTIKKYSPLLIFEQENGTTETIDFCKTLGYDVLDWDDAKRNVIMAQLIG